MKLYVYVPIIPILEINFISVFTIDKIKAAYKQTTNFFFAMIEKENLSLFMYEKRL